MTGRRRYPRYLLSKPVEGHLHVRDEVAIERWTDDELEVLSVLPSRPDEQLVLEVPGNGRSQVAVTVRESRAVISPDGSIRYRLRMSFDQAPSCERP